MPLTTDNSPLIPKKINRSQLSDQSAEARAADLKVWRDTLYRSAEFREALFGNGYTDRFAYEGAAYIMNDDGKLESANTLWDEPDRYHNAVMSDRLFVRDSHDTMRQVQVKENDGRPTLELSRPLNGLGSVQAPEAPSTIKYILRFLTFGLMFRGEIAEYNRQKAIYDAINTDDAKATFQTAIRSYPKRDGQEQVEKVTGKQLEQQHKQIKESLKQLDEELKQIEHQHGVDEQPQIDPKPESAPIEQQPQVVEQPIQQEQPEQVKQSEEIPQDIARGLEPYNEEAVNRVFSKITISTKDIPKNNLVNFKGETIGLLMIMSLGSKDLSIKISQAGDRQMNDPDVNYKRIVDGHYIRGNEFTHKTEPRFERAAYRMVVNDLKTAIDTGDYSKLGKFIAEGLTQNNKMLQEQRKLTDVYTAYANIGAKMLDFIGANPQIEKAVKAHLGPDSKQIDIAKAAKNISDLRVETMDHYKTMVAQYGVFTERTVKKGNETSISKNLVVQGDPNHVAKVCLVSDIEVEMNLGRFKLEGSEFVDPNVAGKKIADIENTKVINSFLLEENRCEILQDPVKMKMINKAAVKESVQQKELQQKMKEAGIDVENEQKERIVDISIG